ncbi:hypothetical protein PIROE2DRAFT_17814 [Piromyces sp. E2]|nr:hypothetical protein PIROE2DRAFT_17814 [Piromyces sp. E2]|eukprot:OUM57260.1 hypothetical protein PIROE2DRAFT_17814 [Piromyces sp. E2]
MELMNSSFALSIRDVLDYVRCLTKPIKKRISFTITKTIYTPLDTSVSSKDFYQKKYQGMCNKLLWEWNTYISM